jgi:hypothetical protein
VTSTPPPFEIVLVDDSSRVARDLPDALGVLRALRFAGIRVLYLSQGIDSDHEQAETLVTVHGLVDSLYLREMAAKIRRGLAGQLGRGFATGGVTYGYRTVPVVDPTRTDECLGYRVEIEPTEAAFVRRVFEAYAEGQPLAAIIAMLRKAGAPPPRGGGSRGDWRIAAVRRLLVNERYLGKLIWGRTRLERKPSSRTKVQRRLPRGEWRIVERPELRLVSDELWDRVQRRRHHLSTHFAAHRQPGRTLLRGRPGVWHGRGLFTGYLRCGECGRSVSVVSQHRYRGRLYRYYGCMNSAKNGIAVCRNRVTVRAEEAERALLAGLQAEMSRPETLDYIVGRLSAALQAATEARPPRRETLVQQRDAIAQKIRHLVAAIESGMASATVLQALSGRECELAKVDGEIAVLHVPVDARRVTVIPNWVKQQVTDLVALLQDRPERVKAELSRLGVRVHAIPGLRRA